MRVAHAQLLLGNREQRTAVSGRELPFFDPLLDLLVELEQTNRVRHRSAVFPGPLRDGILRQVKFVHQSLKRTRRFYGIQILALNVLDEGHFEREFVGHLPHNGRDFVEPSALRCAPAALAGDQLKARTDRPQDQRLNDSAGLNGARQFVKGLLVEFGTRLIRARLNQVDIDFLGTTLRGLAGGHGRDGGGVGCRGLRLRRWRRRLGPFAFKLPNERSESPSQCVSRH